jgi:type IV pilus assembly protein PilB
MSHPERCPSCYQKVGPEDFLCPRCELILQADVEEITAPTEVSVVRRMLERPQARVSSASPPPPPPLPKSSPEESIGRTKMMVLPPGLEEIPRVVAGLRLACMDLTPFEAWVVSGIDGISSGKALENIFGLASMELRVVLQTLRDKGVISIEPAPAPPRREASAPPPPSRPASDPARSTEVPRSRPAVQPTPPVALKPLEPETDPRVAVANALPKNRKVLDALKQVKRTEAPTGPAPRPAPPPEARKPSDVRAESSLQVALRMEQSGKLNEAVAYLERAIERSPDAAMLYNRLAVILVRERGQLRKAEQLLEKAIELDAENGVYRQNLLKVIDKRANRARS